MDPKVKIGIGFAVGFCAGAATAYFTLRDKFSKLAQDEIDDYRQSIRAKVKAIREFEEEHPSYISKEDDSTKTDYTDFYRKLPDSINKENLTPYSHSIGSTVQEVKNELDKISQETNDKDFDIHMADREYPEDELDSYEEGYLENKRLVELAEKAREDGGPRLISYAQFNNQNQWYAKINFEYYEDDGTVVDDAGEAIEDPEEYLCPHYAELFGRDSENPDVIYIRDDRTQADIELTRVSGKYIPKPEIAMTIGGSSNNG